MARVPTFLLATLGSAFLLVLGGLSAYSNVVWRVEWGYDVDVAAPAGVTWTMWIPHPGVSMPWTATGSAEVIGTIDTPYGTRINVTGKGDGGLRFSNSTSVVGVAPTSGIPPTLSLSGGEGVDSTAFYRIWRLSSNPSANLTLTGGLWFAARASAELETCDGSGFVGHPEEGWHSLPFRDGECVHRFTRSPTLIPLLLVGPGSVLAGVLVAARRDPTRP